MRAEPRAAASDYSSALVAGQTQVTLRRGARFAAGRKSQVAEFRFEGSIGDEGSDILYCATVGLNKTSISFPQKKV